MYKNQYQCKVVSSKKICKKFYRLCLDAKQIARQTKPGQFIHIRTSDSLKPFFRRPFSVYRADKCVEILYEVVGPGTALLASKKPKDFLDAIGPLGNSFSMPKKEIKYVVMVAGGVGIAPFLTFTDKIKNKGHELILLYGGRSKDYVYDMKEFKRNGCKIFVSTDDGTKGIKGRVSRLFKNIPRDPKKTFVYTCGPRPMMASVKEFVLKHNISCEASCEEVMACGIGTCLGCSTKTVEGYKTVCKDGPVFDIRKIIF